MTSKISDLSKPKWWKGCTRHFMWFSVLCFLQMNVVRKPVDWAPENFCIRRGHYQRYWWVGVKLLPVATWHHNNMTSVSGSMTSYLRQYGNQLFLSTLWHNLLLFWCHDVGLLLCSLVQIKLPNFIWKSAELVVLIPMAISRELCNLLCNSCCSVNSLPISAIANILDLN